jgi:hypothetical protein
MKPSDADLHKYVSDFSDMLMQIDVVVPDDVKLVMLLENVPPHVSQWVLDHPTRTFTEAKRLLLEYHERHGSHGSTDRGERKQKRGKHQHGENDQKGNKKFKKRQVTCYACGGPHYANRCTASDDQKAEYRRMNPSKKYGPKLE